MGQLVAMEVCLTVLIRLARWLFGDYEAYWVLDYRPLNSGAGLCLADGLVVLSENDLASSEHALLQEQLWYLGPQAHAFGWKVEGALQAICVYWHGERYRARNFWPLAHREAKLVQVTTVPSARGRGYAGRLIAASTQVMTGGHGFERLLARVWLTNEPSLRAFRSAGWRRIALVLTVAPRLLWWRGKRFRICVGSAPKGLAKPRASGVV